MKRVLVAGVGNVFLGDDGFGVAVVERLSRRSYPSDVRVADFGIRGLDLAYELLEGWERLILIDAVRRGGAPGTLYVLEPELGGAAPPLGGHSLVPAQVLAMAELMGGTLPVIRVVGCEAKTIPSIEELAVGLSPEVAAAIDPAVLLVEELLEVTHA